VTEEDKVMAYIPKTMKIYSKDIQYRSGGKRAQVNLIKKKKRGEQGQRTVEIEKELYESSLWTATSIDDLTNKYSKHDGYKENLRDFYYSKSMVKQRRSELSLQRTKDRVQKIAYVRKSANSLETSRSQSCLLEIVAMELAVTLKGILNMVVNGNLLYTVTILPFVSQTSIIRHRHVCSATEN
ncbi:hypothetical protein HPULCUR_003493, partial [Helicostylum pulchrum]